MNLFEYRNWKLEIRPEAFTIKAFKDIIDRDKHKDKNNAIKELAYVYHMADNTSPFSSYLDENRKSADIIKKLNLDPKWKPDKNIIEAINVYKELDETITSRYLESVSIALSKIDTYFRTFTISEDTDSADVKRIDDMVKSSINTVKSLRELEKLVKQDKETNDTLKGGRKKPLYLDE